MRVTQVNRIVSVHAMGESTNSKGNGGREGAGTTSSSGVLMLERVSALDEAYADLHLIADMAVTFCHSDPVVATAVADHPFINGAVVRVGCWAVLCNAAQVSCLVVLDRWELSLVLLLLLLLPLRFAAPVATGRADVAGRHSLRRCAAESASCAFFVGWKGVTWKAAGRNRHVVARWVPVLRVRRRPSSS